MHSLRFQLGLVFFLLILFQAVIGGVGIVMLRDASRAIDNDRQVFNDTQKLFTRTGDYVEDHGALLNRFTDVLGDAATQHGATVDTLATIEKDSLPRLLFIGQFGAALNSVNAAERALLLTLTVRNLSKSSLDTLRFQQKRQLAAAIKQIGDERERYEKLPPGSEEEERLWKDFLASYEVWWANHEQFMTHIANLEKLMADMIRDGPLFWTEARAAYDTVFITGRDARAQCQEKLGAIGDHVIATVTAGVAAGSERQQKSLEAFQDRAEEAKTSRAGSAALAADLLATQDRTTGAINEAGAAQARVAGNFYWLLAILAVVVFASCFFGLYFARRITGPILDLTRLVGHLARGDLGEDVARVHLARRDEVGQFAYAVQDLIDATREEIRLVDAMAGGDYTGHAGLRSPEDQLGRALDTMLEITNQMLRQVNRAVDQVTRGADSMSGASQSLSQGASESAMALEEISTSINSVDSQTRGNAEKAVRASHLASDSRDAARRGYDAVLGMSTAMKEIQDAGEAISSVAKLIDNIAFQTNLLALNASVEAARAGRHGKGFSVVADEVRNLAGRSAKAAGETTTMLADMVQRVTAGVELAKRTDGELRAIVDSTEQVAAIFDEIAGASHEQSTAINQIASGLGQIDNVIRQNTTNANQTAAAAETLSRQAASLAGLVERFRLRPEGASRHLREPAAEPVHALPTRQDGAGHEHQLTRTQEFSRRL